MITHTLNCPGFVGGSIFLRGWSNEQIQKIFPGNPGTCSTHGV